MTEKMQSSSSSAEARWEADEESQCDDTKRLSDEATPRNAPAATASAGNSVGWTVKIAVLAALCVQNTVYTLLRRYSYGVLHEKYSAQSVLLVGEVMKLFFSAAMTLGLESCEVNKRESGFSPSNAVHKLVHLTRTSLKMSALAGIYGAMNILSYVSLRRIDAAVFTVCAQLKILTTAGFAVVVLRKRLTPTKWRALLLLVLACILVTVPQLSATKGKEADAAQKKTHTDMVIGVSAVLVEVTLSGFASIYFEKVVKNTNEGLSVWDRNFQLALHSILLYAFYDFVSGFFIERPAAIHDVAASGFFHDFSAITWALAILGAAGGLLVALTVKVADSVVKTLAVSFSIVLSTLASHFVLAGPLDLAIGIGACCATLAVLDYSFDATPEVKS